MGRFIEPVTLTGRNWVVLEPMQSRHEADLLEAAKDGELWNLWYTSVGTPDGKAHLRWLLDKPRG